MNILLDTQALILAGNNHLPPKAKKAYLDPQNTVYFSLVSLWEIGIKVALGKLDFKLKLSAYHDLLLEKVGLLELPLDLRHIEKAVGLPFHHKDPFDRLLIGQALTQKLAVMASDEIYSRYGCTCIWNE